METIPEWNAEEALAALALIPWEGSVWRVHWRDVLPNDWALSLRVSGRYHRGRDLHTDSHTWPALYTSLQPEIAVWEMVRQRVGQRAIPFLANNCLSQMRVPLNAVLDCSDPSLLGLSRGALTGQDTSVAQSLALAALHRRATGILVPSASMQGTNLVILPDNLEGVEAIEVVSTIPMPLDLPHSRE